MGTWTVLARGFRCNCPRRLFFGPFSSHCALMIRKSPRRVGPIVVERPTETSS
jgi:hypothetical protein